jgi:hypothetical protein
MKKPPKLMKEVKELNTWREIACSWIDSILPRC